MKSPFLAGGITTFLSEASPADSSCSPMGWKSMDAMAPHSRYRYYWFILWYINGIDINGIDTIIWYTPIDILYVISFLWYINGIDTTIGVYYG